jgi:predicted MPP superfamily phosphohydrolase
MMQLNFFAASFISLLSGHALFWYVFIKFFHINARHDQIIAALIIFLLFAGSIISSMLIHKRDNWFTRSYYILSGLWMGLILNAYLIVIPIIFIKLASAKFDFPFPDLYMWLIFFGGTLTLSLVGIYNALALKIVEYEVNIKDLPDFWNNKTVVQISDVHLGPVYRKKFFYHLIKMVNTLAPAAVFITGDLFDGVESDFSWMNHPFNNLPAPQGIYYSYGNHDLYLGYNRVKSLLKDNPVKILNNKMEIVEGLQIIGINYSFDSDFDLEEAILKQVGYSPVKPSILLFHAPRNINLARKVGIDLQLSGHTHDGQMFPFNHITKWTHSGYGYGLFQFGDFHLIVSGGAGSWGPMMRTSARSEIVKIVLKRK